MALLACMSGSSDDSVSSIDSILWDASTEGLASLVHSTAAWFVRKNVLFLQFALQKLGLKIAIGEPWKIPIPYRSFIKDHSIDIPISKRRLCG